MIYLLERNRNMIALEVHSSKAALVSSFGKGRIMMKATYNFRM
jgi:hypothetical protein